MTIQNLKKKDHSKAIYFAIQGMQFDRYLASPFLQKLYGRYFLYMELNRSAQILAAYDGNRLVGLLLASIYGKPVRHQVKAEQLYVSLFKKMEAVYTKGTDSYHNANRIMYLKYRHRHKPDGELILLAADPNYSRKGIGSLLLAELERREKGKEIFLYTDSNCTYQFYEKRGFQQAAEAKIVMSLPDGNVPLTCYLYRKKLGDEPV